LGVRHPISSVIILGLRNPRKKEKSGKGYRYFFTVTYTPKGSPQAQAINHPPPTFRNAQRIGVFSGKNNF